MKKTLLGMAAVSALAIAAPAAAQYSSSGYQNNASGSVAMRISQLQTRIQAGVQSGAISRQEAIPLRQQVRQLTRLERQYSANGLSGQERADLQQRTRDLRQQIRAADGGDRARWDRYDREDGYAGNDRYDRDDDYGRNDRYDDRIDSNRDGYDDRDYDRDGRWDDDVNNGGYQQPARGGLGGVIDAIVGGGGLRVGQRASSDLYGVPGEYRDQYRDGNGVYYRSDGRRIYQIDARSQTVARVFAMNR